MTKGIREYYPDGINVYVPGAEYDADITLNSPFRVSLGTPAVASAVAIDDSGAIDDAGGTTVLATKHTMDSPFGRAVQIKGDTAADDAVVTVHGFDYLGQPMSEAFTLNGTTPVLGLKAFHEVTKYVWAAGNANATSAVDLGTLDVLGLPFKALRVTGEDADGVDESTLGTFVAPDETDPATTTTDDTRGTYNPTTTLDGTAEISVTYETLASVNAAGNGGLHGIAQV